MLWLVALIRNLYVLAVRAGNSPTPNSRLSLGNMDLSQEAVAQPENMLCSPLHPGRWLGASLFTREMWTRVAMHCQAESGER